MVKMSAKRSDSPTQLLKSKTKCQLNDKSESMKHVTEMDKSHNIYKAYSLHDDKNSDFTVLDLGQTHQGALKEIPENLKRPFRIWICCSGERRICPTEPKYFSVLVFFSLYLGQNPQIKETQMVLTDETVETRYVG